MRFWGRHRPRKLVFLVGLYTIGYGIYDMSYAAVTQNYREGVYLRSRYGPGTYVVITGATNPLGHEFIRALAKFGFNFIIIDSKGEKLEKLCSDVKQMTTLDIEVKPIEFKFKKINDWREYEKLNEKIKELTGENQVSILINNFEKFDPYTKNIHQAKDEEVIETLTANTYPIAFMTRFVGADMKNRKSDRKSAIINITSYYSDYPVFTAPVYSAAKAYQDVVSQIIGFENQDIDILTVKNIPYKSKKHPKGVDACETVEGILKDIGHERISYGHWKHSLFRYYYLFKQCGYFIPSARN